MYIFCICVRGINLVSFYNVFFIGFWNSFQCGIFLFFISLFNDTFNNICQNERLQNKQNNNILSQVLILFCTLLQTSEKCLINQTFLLISNPDTKHTCFRVYTVSEFIESLFSLFESIIKTNGFTYIYLSCWYCCFRLDCGL